MAEDKKLITFWAENEVHAMLEALANHDNKKKSQVLRDLISLEFFRRKLQLDS